MDNPIPLLLILLAIDSVFVIAMSYLKKWKWLAFGIALAGLLDYLIVYFHNNV